MPAKTHASPAGYLDELRAVAGQIDQRAVEETVDALLQTWRQGGQVFVFGNGGSAATASHAVADLVKTAAVDGMRRLRAMCLSDNAALLSAIGNDLRFEDVFLYPLQAHAHAGDLAVAISASGNSPNVLRACEWARAGGVRVIGLTGFSGGQLAGLCDIRVHVPSENYGIIEDMHMVAMHMVAQGLHHRLTRESKAACAS